MLDIMRENAQSWIIKILFAIIILAFVLSFGLSSFNNNGDPIFAYVNGDPITTQEYETTLANFVENYRNKKGVSPEMLNSPAMKEVVKNQLIEDRLLLQEANRLGLTVTDEELSSIISGMPAFQGPNNIFDPVRFEMMVKALKMTPEQYENSVRKDYLKLKLFAFVSKPAQATPEQGRAIYDWQREAARIKFLTIKTSDFMDQVEVTPEQVEKYYQDNLDKLQNPLTASFEFIAFTPQHLASLQEVSEDELKDYYESHKDEYRQEEQVKARHIILMLDENAPQAEVEAAAKKIKAILAKAKAGKDFAELAMEYSEGPSAPAGGDLGWFGRNAMVPEFETAAFSLKKGEVSKPVRTQFGLHLIKVEDRKEAKALDFDEVKEDIKFILAQDKASDMVHDMVDSTMDRLYSGMSLAEIAKELKLETMKTPLLPIEVTQRFLGMNSAAAEALYAAPVGESPKTPLSIGGGYLLAVKTEEKPAAAKPLEEVRNDITAVLKSIEASKLAKAKAEEVMAALNGEAAGEALVEYGKDLVEPEPFDRKGPIQGLEQNNQILHAVFSAPQNGWIANVFMNGDDYTLVNRVELIPAPEAGWEKDKEVWIRNATGIYEKEMFDAFVKDLHANAKIEIERKDLLN